MLTGKCDSYMQIVKNNVGSNELNEVFNKYKKLKMKAAPDYQIFYKNKICTLWTLSSNKKHNKNGLG